MVRIEPQSHRVVVGPRAALATRTVHLRDVNWIGPGDLSDIPAEGLEIYARLRSTRVPVPAQLLVDASGVRVALAHGEDGVSPGQACVFSESGEATARVLGGGFIKATAAAVAHGTNAA